MSLEILQRSFSIFKGVTDLWVFQTGKTSKRIPSKFICRHCIHMPTYRTII